MNEPGIVPPTEPFQATNLSNGTWTEGTFKADINSPYTGTHLCSVHYADEAVIETAVEAAKEAYNGWRTVPIKERCALLLRFRELLLRELEEISHTASLESGKLFSEARAEVLKGIEVLEFAASLQNSDCGGSMEVSRGVTCEYRREPLGVVLGITPFNFPAMVPMWMIPIAIALGNSFILKPSEKVPYTACLLGKLLAEAGLPSGVFSILHGDKETVGKLITDPRIAAVGFVGSTNVAADVYREATSRDKRALCLGGAKNHIIIVPDAPRDITIEGVVSSYTGCAGQRCMAASVLICVGDTTDLVDAIILKSKQLRLGEDMGCLISEDALVRLRTALDTAQQQGADILLDGRIAPLALPTPYQKGNWLGPSILDNTSPDMECGCTELFGPILSIMHVDSLEEALALENKCPYGNATSIFTSSGSVARYVAHNASAGMLGVNIGVPVPREPFSFGGTKQSKFGHGDITGVAGVEFWSTKKKITTKWSTQTDKNWMS
jgi:malonate-semialdehyde dehydrogenase (acetylating)/methylmalonate-semialdehyde dehydrogenase